MIHHSDSVITFHSEMDIAEFPEPALISEWLISTASEEDKTIESLSYRFVSDDELHELNRKYLNHDTYTDILTFPYSYEPVQSDICISIDRERDNAAIHQTTVLRELLRVMVHGLLHMCGYNDDSEKNVKEMRYKEDHYLAKFEQA